MIPGKIALGNAVSEALSLSTNRNGAGQPSEAESGRPPDLTHDVVLIRGEKPCAGLRHCRSNRCQQILREKAYCRLLTIDLHAHQTLSVAWEVVQGNALAEVDLPLVYNLPVEVKIQIVLEVDAGKIRPGVSGA